jgi:hypothetical protein
VERRCLCMQRFAVEVRRLLGELTGLSDEVVR